MSANEIQQSNAQILLLKLREQKFNKRFCDVQFYYGESNVLAHSCVLASFSPFLMKLLINLSTNQKDNMIKLPLRIHTSIITHHKDNENNCFECVHKVVDYLYTGKIKLDPAHISHIINISNNLGIEKLIFICQKFLILIKENTKSFSFENKSIIKANLNDNKTSSSIIYDDSVFEEAAEYNLDLSSRPILIDGGCNIEENEICKDMFVKYCQVIAKSLETSEKFDEKGLIAKSLETSEKSDEEGLNYSSMKIDEEMNLGENSTSELQSKGKKIEGGNSKINCVFKNENESPFLQSHVIKSIREKKNPEIIEVNTITNQKLDSDILETYHNNTIKNNGNYVCKKCHTIFSQSAKLKQHEEVFHSRNYICLSCKYTSYKIRNMISHLKKCFSGDKLCSICLYEVSSDQNLHKHLDEHIHKLPFLCKVCNERFKNRSEWHKHKAIHSTKCPFICKECNMTFKRFSYLKNHIINTHGKPNHLCDECGYTTVFHSYLLKHKLKHVEKNRQVNFNKTASILKKTNEEKPFQCRQCKIKFGHDRNLRRHIQLVHNTKVYIFNCPSCDYQSVRFDKVKEHCKTNHNNDKNVLDKINEQYKISKENPVPQVIPRYMRSSYGKQKCTKSKADKTSKIDLLNTNINSNLIGCLPPSFNYEKNNLHIPSQSLSITNVVNPNEMLSNASDSKLEVSSTSMNSLSKPTVFLSESTGEISIMSESEGQPIPVASVTSTNLLTIGNFREGTGSMTLNETTGVLTLNNINSESTGAVFLNESTGELSYINLNSENHDNVRIKDQSLETIGLVTGTSEPATLLNEETGEISTILDGQISNNNPLTGSSINTGHSNEDDMFDFFDIDAFNEDSFDGFDEFDEFLFDTLNPLGSEAENPMKNFLNEFTGELSVDDAHFTKLESSMTLAPNRHMVPQEQGGNFSNIVWNAVTPITSSRNLSIAENSHVFSQTLLNEETGEFVLN